MARPSDLGATVTSRRACSKLRDRTNVSETAAWATRHVRRAEARVDARGAKRNPSPAIAWNTRESPSVTPATVPNVETMRAART